MLSLNRWLHSKLKNYYWSLGKSLGIFWLLGGKCCLVAVCCCVDHFRKVFLSWNCLLNNLSCCIFGGGGICNIIGYCFSGCGSPRISDSLSEQTTRNIRKRKTKALQINSHTRHWSDSNRYIFIHIKFVLILSINLNIIFIRKWALRNLLPILIGIGGLWASSLRVTLNILSIQILINNLSLKFSDIKVCWLRIAHTLFSDSCSLWSLLSALFILFFSNSSS